MARLNASGVLMSGFGAPALTVEREHYLEAFRRAGLD
jgi:hypothetical protein